MAKANSKNPSSKREHVSTDNIFSRTFRKLGWLIDWFFSNKLALIIVSIVASLIFYYTVNGLPNHQYLASVENRTLQDVKIEVNNTDNAKVIEIYDAENRRMDPNNLLANVILTGPRNEVLKVVNKKEYSFFIDTSDLKDGDNKELKVLYKGISDKVSVSVSPASYRVEAYKKVPNNNFVLTSEPVNLDKMGENLTIETVTLNTTDVLISGSKKNIDAVSSVRALLDMQGIQSSGEHILTSDDISYRAYNNRGDVVDVEIDVKDEGATVLISDYNKEVTIVYNFVGTPPDGKSIGTFESSVPSVNLYGDKSIIDNIDSIEVDVKLSDIKSNNKTTVNIPKPDGVVSMSSTQSTVTITYEDTVTRLFTGIPVNSVNLEPGLSVQSAEADLLIDVEVSGAESIVNAMTNDDIIIVADLVGIGAGEVVVTLSISNPDSRLTYKLSKEKVTLIITQN